MRSTPTLDFSPVPSSIQHELPLTAETLPQTLTRVPTMPIPAVDAARFR